MCYMLCLYVCWGCLHVDGLPANVAPYSAHIDLNNHDCLCMYDCFDALNSRSLDPMTAGFLTLLRARSLQSATRPLGAVTRVHVVARM
jgi:hypothetical protein